jgi:TolA-binding protein
LTVGAALLIAVAATPFTHAAEQPPSPQAQINALIINHHYDRAVQGLRDLVVAEPDNADELRLRLARLLITSGEPRQALPVCEEVIGRGPDSPHWRKAHFIAADAHASLGDFARAEALIEGQVTHLLSPDRKAELAQIYIDHADGLFDPEDEDETPNFELARFYYEKALDLELSDEQSRALRHRVGQCWVEQANWHQAVEIYRALLDESEETPLHATALFELARAELNTGQRVEARHHLRRLAAEHPDTPEIPDATWLLPQTFGGAAPPSDLDLILAVDALREFVERHPDHEKAPEAALAIARAHQHRGRTAEAIAAAEEFLAKEWKVLTPDARALGEELLLIWPELREPRDAIERLLLARVTDPRAIEAMQRHGGEHFMDSELVPEARILLGDLQRSAQAFDEARGAWDTFLREHATNPRWTEIQRRLVDLDFDEARHLIAEEQWDDARRRLRDFLDAYPLDPRQPEALFLLGRIEEEREQWEEALAVWADLADKHPGSEPARSALMRSAEIAEKELGDVARARELYRKARDTGAAPATLALTRMETPELTVQTERAFRPGDTPSLHLTTRNIEAVDCEAYAIDLETYFRTKHTLAGVAGLDIALIDPDQTWRHEVEDYEEFRLHETDIELPLEGTGAWAIRLATEDLEASTLVVVTDLAIITKASRNQVLVFAQRWGDAEPAEGVRVLLSDGAEVFAEITTGPDGTALYEDASSDDPGAPNSETRLQDLASLRVFAVDGASVASNDLDLQAVEHVEGRRPRGFLWSAKPVYQPGQTAQIAGVIRVVQDGRYTFAEGEEWTVTVADDRGQTLLIDTVTLDEFGTFALACPLPPSLPLGQCTVTVGRPGDPPGPTFSGHFLVDRYQVDQVQLTVDLEQRVIVRGDPITATVTVRRYTGEPLRGERIFYQLPGDIRHEGTTDDSGQLEIELPTGEIPGELPLTLSVSLPRENLTVGEVVLVSETSVEAPSIWPRSRSRSPSTPRTSPASPSEPRRH